MFEIKDIEAVRKMGYNIRCSNCTHQQFHSERIKHYCNARDINGKKREDDIGLNWDKYYPLSVEELGKGCKYWFYFDSKQITEEEREIIYGD